MKTRVLLIGAVVTVSAAAGMYLWMAPGPGSSRSAAPARPEVAVAGGPAPAVRPDLEATGVDDARRAETAAAYAELEASRKVLQKQLNDLRSFLWGRELPAARARRISRDMMSAQYLLKEPPLLGAFTDAAGVHAEKDRVDAARIRLEEISRELREPAAKI